MWLVLWSPEVGLGHATLLVQTDDAGAVEIGVSPGETPHPFDIHQGRRFGLMPMTGHGDLLLEPGYSLVRDDAGNTYIAASADTLPPIKF
jgi:hypothetical protein